MAQYKRKKTKFSLGGGMFAFINDIPFYAKLAIGLFIAAVLLYCIAYQTIWQKIVDEKNLKSPIVAIAAANEHAYNYQDDFTESDFKVVAKRKNGSTLLLSPKEYVIDRTYVHPYGKTTNVVVSLKKDKSISCTCTVKNIRKKLYTWEVGTPVASDLTATLYSNGELHFSGKGDLRQFNEIPWCTQLKSDKDVVRSIIFDESVGITDISHMFENLPYLVYVSRLPSTLVSMESAFENDYNLRDAAEFGDSRTITNLARAYAGCSMITSCGDIPDSAQTTAYMFEGCSALQSMQDMSRCINLRYTEHMYADCEVLTGVKSLPPNVTDMSFMFLNCINLKTMPEIPVTVQTLESSFSGCMSLSTAAVIPAGITNMISTFEGCAKLSGILQVEATPSLYDNFLANAVITTRLDVQGSSGVLENLVLTGNSNITMNGQIVGEHIDRSLQEIPSTPSENASDAPPDVTVDTIEPLAKEKTSKKKKAAKKKGE